MVEEERKELRTWMRRKQRERLVEYNKQRTEKRERERFPFAPPTPLVRLGRSCSCSLYLLIFIYFYFFCACVFIQFFLFVSNLYRFFCLFVLFNRICPLETWQSTGKLKRRETSRFLDK